MESKEVSRKTKMRVCRVAIRPAVTYWAETMILTKGEEEKLRRFERKIYGPKKVVEGVYQRLMNSEVQEKLQGEDAVKAIKTRRLRWYGHVRRIWEENVMKKVTEWRPNFERARGRPKSRREERILGDIKRLRIHNWRRKIQDWKSWKGITKEVKSKRY